MAPNLKNQVIFLKYKMFQGWYMSEINPLVWETSFKVHGHGHHQNQKSWILYTCIYKLMTL